MAGLVPWDSFRDLERIFKAMDAYMEEVFTQSVDSFFDDLGIEGLKIEDSAEKISVQFYVPDELRNKLSVRVKANKIEVYGQDKQEHDSGGANNSTFKSFYQCYHLPGKVAAEKADVDFDGNKILIKIPKK